MSYEEPTPRDRLLFDIENALHRPGEADTDPTFAHELVASNGKPGVTTLFTECYVAIDKLPKAFSPRRIGRTALNDEAQTLVDYVDQAIELNPLYDGGVYDEAKEMFDYWAFKEPPKGALTERGGRYFAERGLAALHNAVTNGFSTRRPNLKAWRTQTPVQLIETMKLNKALDVDVINAVGEARNSGNISTDDYVKSLISLAGSATDLIVNPPESAESNITKPNIKDTIKSELSASSVTFLGSTAFTEALSVAAVGHPTIYPVMGAFVGTAIVRGLKRL